MQIFQIVTTLFDSLYSQGLHPLPYPRPPPHDCGHAHQSGGGHPNPKGPDGLRHWRTPRTSPNESTS